MSEVKMKPRLLRRFPYTAGQLHNCVFVFVSTHGPIKRGTFIHEIVRKDGVIRIVKAGDSLPTTSGEHVIERIYKVGINLTLNPETGIREGDKLYQMADGDEILLIPEARKADWGIE